MGLTEKYRPRTFEEFRGQEHIVESVQSACERIKNGTEMDFLFIGQPGVGKTSMAQAMARDIWDDKWRQHYKEMNASSADRGIDTVRGKIKNYAQMQSRKLIFLDEADHMTNDAQHALRRTMEKWGGTVFVLSANYPHKIINAIKSRCVTYNFKQLSDDAMLKRLLEIVKKEEIEIDYTQKIKNGFKSIVEQSHGDMRWAINTLEKIIGKGKRITEQAVLQYIKPDYSDDALRKALDGNWLEAKNLIEDGFITNDFNYQTMLSGFYDAIDELNIDKEVKIRLYQKLKETDRALRMGGNPLYQLVGFISDAWVVKHIKAGEK